MTSSGTDSTLSFNYGTHTLSATNISGNLNATQLTSGTVPIARLGDSGTKSGSTFLAGDNTFKTVVVAINSISGDANNRIITSDGDGTATAESKLTFDGTTLQLGASTKLDLSTNDSYLNARVMRNESGGSDDGMYIGYGNANSGHTRIYGGGATSGGITVQGSGNGDCYVNGNVIWNSGNDGSGTGLDADTVDGIQGANFVRSDTTDTMSGDYNITGKLLIGGAYGNNSYNSVSSTRLLFGGGDDQDNYHIGTNMENYGGNYTKLDLRWHTGIRMGAQPSYGGVRIFNNEDLSTLLFSVGRGDGNTRVESGNLYIGGNEALHNGNQSNINYNNLSNKPSVASVLYIDVYGQGNAGDRNTARNWATSAVSVPNNTMFVVRWNRTYSYWVNNNTATGNEDRKTLWIKNSSGSIYWAGADST